MAGSLSNICQIWTKEKPVACKCCLTAEAMSKFVKPPPTKRVIAIIATSSYLLLLYFRGCLEVTVGLFSMQVKPLDVKTCEDADGVFVCGFTINLY